MYKYILIGLILLALNWNAVAQDRKTLADEIKNKMSFMKNGNEKRQIEFRDSIYGTPFIKLVPEKNISKDSLRHLLVDHGFNDFNFEYFRFKVKNLDDLNEQYLEGGHPEILKLLSDSRFNKVTFSYNTELDGVTVVAVISENEIQIDNKKYGNVVIGVGYFKEEVTYKGTSNVKNIYYAQEGQYSDILKKKNIKKQLIGLSDSNRFEIKVDIRAHKSIYTAIMNVNGDILSIVKMY